MKIAYLIEAKRIIDGRIFYVTNIKKDPPIHPNPVYAKKIEMAKYAYLEEVRLNKKYPKFEFSVKKRLF